MDRRALATLFLAAPPTFAAILYLYLRTSPASTATYNLTATPAHHVSYAQSLLNPRRFLTEQDSLTLVLPTRQHPSLKTLNDEEILARFTRGFHGGWAFWIERRFFQASGWSITRLAGTLRDNPVSQLRREEGIRGLIWHSAQRGQPHRAGRLVPESDFEDDRPVARIDAFRELPGA